MDSKYGLALVCLMVSACAQASEMARVDLEESNADLLGQAVDRGDVALARRLLGGKADVNILLDSQGHTALHRATHFDFVTLLYEHRCDPSILTKDGDSPLDTVIKFADESEDIEQLCDTVIAMIIIGVPATTVWNTLATERAKYKEEGAEALDWLKRFEAAIEEGIEERRKLEEEYKKRKEDTAPAAAELYDE